MLADKVAVITGGTRGIGYATAELFLEQGAKVVIFGSKANTVEAAINKLKATNHEFPVSGEHPVLHEKADVVSTFERIVNKFGKIDILVNNAGIASGTPLADFTMEEYMNIMNLNVTGAFLCSQEAAAVMVKQGSGVILNNASIAGVYGNSKGIAYPTSKGAVIAMTKSLAKELGPKGIRANAVVPGWVATEMVVEDAPQEMIQALAMTIPARRLGSPREIAYGFLYLASDQAAFCNGTILNIDGGGVLA